MERILDEIINGKRVIKLKVTKEEIEAMKKHKAEIEAKLAKFKKKVK